MERGPLPGPELTCMLAVIAQGDEYVNLLLFLRTARI